MRFRKFFLSHLAAILLGLMLGALPTYAGTAGGGYAGHRVVAGDFNGDGWADLLLQPLPGAKDSALLLSLPTGAFGKPATWADPHADERWNADAHRLYVGDFTGDGRDDVFMQAAAGLASAVMLAGPKGNFTRAPQGAFTTIGGLDVSQAKHAVVVGDFNGDGRADLLFQADNGFAQDGIALSGPSGGFKTLGAEWANGALGLNWSDDLAALTAGDFSGTGRSELLLRDRSGSGGMDYVVSLNKSEQPSRIVQSWKSSWLGLDWLPADTKAIAADLNGDGRADLLLQPEAPGGEGHGAARQCAGAIHGDCRAMADGAGRT
ncbi:MAG: FG-GAP repeat domain-containing protein [Gammaproteobacteria bacterium]